MENQSTECRYDHCAGKECELKHCNNKYCLQYCCSICFMMDELYHEALAFKHPFASEIYELYAKNIEWIKCKRNSMPNHVNEKNMYK